MNKSRQIYLLFTRFKSFFFLLYGHHSVVRTLLLLITEVTISNTDFYSGCLDRNFTYFKVQPFVLRILLSRFLLSRYSLIHIHNHLLNL